VPYAGSWEKIGAIWLSYNWLKKGSQVQVTMVPPMYYPVR